MNYFEASGMYQEIAVDLKYAEFLGKSRETVMEEWALKHGREKILECMEALFKDIDEKKEHYAALGRIALSLLKRKGL